MILAGKVLQHNSKFQLHPEKTIVQMFAVDLPLKIGFVKVAATSQNVSLRALHAHCALVTAASAQMLEPVIAPATALRKLIMTRFSPNPPPLSIPEPC